ncbi:hypothetical protein BJ912DRAFT_504246 [Pholiota molesta]|nr:hypothetical protein BJ912DRAFT_504246 [Pholiota molesta]
MEAIQDAIRRLESIPSTTKKRKDVEAAIIQLSSTARLLDLPSASPNTFARLAENLRGRLLPLYRVSLSLTLDYAIAVFRFIHYSKLVPILQVGHSLPNSWETLLVSLFSGLLDLLEENSNNKIRENIAYALYLSFVRFISFRLLDRHLPFTVNSYLRRTKYLRPQLLLIHVMPQHCANIIFKEKALVSLFRRRKTFSQSNLFWISSVA